MTRVIATVCWFDESPVWIAATVASCARFCDHIVAVDGAYALYPDARARSGSEQHEAFIETCAALNMGLTMHVPRTPWYGGEVEKRTRLMQFAVAEGSPDDWAFIIDADEVVEEAPGDVHARLAGTDLHAAFVTLLERDDHHEGDVAAMARRSAIPNEYRSTLRIFYRCLPGLRVEGNHYSYTADGPDGPLLLWGDSGSASMVDALDLSDVVVEHRNHRRPQYRRLAAQSYYRLRDELGVETAPEVKP